jgi:hypothetical protein
MNHWYLARVQFLKRDTLPIASGHSLLAGHPSLLCVHLLPAQITCTPPNTLLAHPATSMLSSVSQQSSS